jgi:bifunctional ADP-heptose synthase (sugar kinase/adenylyltransferase)
MKTPYILLLGDNCRDVYYYGDVKRISPEAPVPVLDFLHKEERHGMAANVWHNLERLGCEVVFITTGRSTKTRFIDIKTSQHILRLDEDPARDPLFVPSLDNAYSTWDAIVISDYDKGSITEDTIEYVKKNYSGPIFIDTKKKDLARYEGMIVKINQKEFHDAISYPKEHLIVTLGDLGAVYKGKVYKTKPAKTYDACGAGDTFFSALVFKYIQTESIEESIIYANAASSITVNHIGVYSPSVEEIEEALQ